MYAYAYEFQIVSRTLRSTNESPIKRTIKKNPRNEALEAKGRAEGWTHENALALRDRINGLEKTVQAARVVLPSNEDLDGIALYRTRDEVCGQAVQKITGSGGTIICPKMPKLGFGEAGIRDNHYVIGIRGKDLFIIILANMN